MHGPYLVKRSKFRTNALTLQFREAQKKVNFHAIQVAIAFQ